MEPLNFTFGERRFTVETGADVLRADMKQTATVDGAEEYALELRFAALTDKCGVKLRWTEPMLGVLAFWSPTAGRAHELRQWWAANTQTASAADGAPVIALFYRGGTNCRTAALSEAVLKTKLGVCVNDFAERDALDFCAGIFETDAPPAETYTLYLRVDGRKKNLSETVGGAARWWERFYPPRRRHAPGHACCAPLWSSWYACHQHPTQETLLKELPVAAGLGFGAMIVDDGWSYAGAGEGDYRHCGTWAPDPEKFPDMKGFAEAARGYGLPAALWFPAAFIGMEDPAYGTFRGRYLTADDRMQAGVLDPRYPDVRAFLTDTYKKACSEWSLGGIKLDFLTDLTRPAPPPGPECDCAATQEGVMKLLEELDEIWEMPESERLTEFRQFYMGPAAAPHCNMLRVCDCAFDVVSNRIGTVDLRMLRYPLAVHSDMLLWAKDETPANCAVMLYNVLFAVPQISVLLQNAPEAQLAVLKTFLSYFNAHRELLLFGELKVYDPELNYTAVSVEDRDLRVTALYAPRVFRFAGKTADVFNATAETALVFTANVPGTAVCYDCFGQQTGETAFAPGAVTVRVPVGGRLSLSAER